MPSSRDTERQREREKEREREIKRRSCQGKGPSKKNRDVLLVQKAFTETLTTLTICRRPSKLNHSFPRPGSLHLESTLRTVHPPQPPPRTRGAGYRPQAICTVACYVMLCKRRHVSGIFLASVCSFFCFGAFRLRLEVDTTRSFQKSRKISAG